MLQRDFKSLAETSRPVRVKRRHLHLLILLASGIVGLVALLNPVHDAEATRSERLRAQDNSPLTLPLPLPTVSADGAKTGPIEESSDTPWQTVTIRSGDTLSSIFARLGFADGEWHSVVRAGEEAKRFQHLRPGQVLKFWRDGEGRLQRVRLNLDSTRTLEVVQREESYVATLHETPLETRINYTQGAIENSLYAAGQRAGLSDSIIMELVNIFGWDIDFALDVRSGDRFMLVYEEYYRDGEKTGDGAILAAEFVNQGKTYRAVRYTDLQGRTSYFDPNGSAMRKTFLRTPVDFRRISSGFQRERFHPVLGKRRPHRGVDYAAATGTPIKATGDGKVVFKGWKGGYGRTLVIQHGGKYSTLYAHLSNYRSGIRVGSRVRQGQTIGYVGKSGLATGPHLHYEFLVDGVHRNPLTVKLPKAEPIPPRQRDHFNQQVTGLLAQLDVLKRTAVAVNAP